MVIALSSITIFAQGKSKIEFSAKDINNKNITSEIFEDAELTMINIWGTFCGPCIKEMPDLAQLNKNNENKGFQIIGIVIDAVNRKGLPDSKQMDAAKKNSKADRSRLYSHCSRFKITEWNITECICSSNNHFCR